MICPTIVQSWRVVGQIIGGYLELDPAFDSAPTPGKVNARALVSVPVRTLNSGKSEMDNVMLEAMKQKNHPKIEYHLTEMVLKEAPKTPDAPLQFDTKGELVVAGVTNKITMPVTMERIEKTKLKFKGSTPIKMTDYGVTPPVKFGVFRTGNEIKIIFEWMTVHRIEKAK